MIKQYIQQSSVKLGMIISMLFLVLSLHGKEIKVLAIGNSFSDDALEHYLYQIGAANGDTIIIGNLAIGGASLELHYNHSLNNAPTYSYRKIVDGTRTITGNATLEQGLKDEEWDFISLQQVSQNSGLYDTFFPYLPRLINYINKNVQNTDFQLVLHMTWAYAADSSHPGFSNYERDQETMYNAIVENVNRVASEMEIPVIVPAGTAIQNARTSKLGDTLTSDGFHLEGTYGKYTASCAWYETLTGKCVVGTPYKPDGISDVEAFIAQASAHFAVINPNKVTNIITCE